MSDITLNTGDDLFLHMGDITLDTREEAEAPITVDEAEAAPLEELSEVLSGFKARAQRENERVEDATDSEYWFCVCFQTRAQKEEFLRRMGWQEVGDKYLDGMACAEVSGITLESRVPELPRLSIDRRLKLLV